MRVWAGVWVWGGVGVLPGLGGPLAREGGDWNRLDLAHEVIRAHQVVVEDLGVCVCVCVCVWQIERERETERECV